MTTVLPTDSDNNAIPALRLKTDAAHRIDFTGTSARNAATFDESTRIISLYATEDVYLKLGNSSVTADSNDHFFPAGVYYDISIGGGKIDQHTHIAAIAVSSNGTLYISEKE